MNFGVIGTNFISDWFVNACRSSHDINITSVYSRSLSTGQAFAEKHQILKVCTDYSVLLQDPDIDCVYIASPNFLHCEQAVLAMEAKKHVLCEKPAATSVDEFLKMKQAALKNQVVFLEAMRSVFDPAYQIVFNHLEKIGPIRRVRFDFCQYSSRYDSFKNGTILNAFKPKLGNGAVMDIGVYCIHTMVHLFGKPDSIKSMSTFLSNGAEGSGSILMGYPGMIGEIEYSKISSSIHGSIIQGEKATMCIDQIAAPSLIEIIYQNGEKEVIYRAESTENMKYEVEVFKTLVDKKVIVHDYYTSSYDTMQIIDEVKKQNNITSS